MVTYRYDRMYIQYVGSITILVIIIVLLIHKIRTGGYHPLYLPLLVLLILAIYLLLIPLCIPNKVTFTKQGIKVPVEGLSIFFGIRTRFIPYTEIKEIRINKFGWLILVLVNGEHVVLNKNTVSELQRVITMVRKNNRSVKVEAL